MPLYLIRHASAGARDLRNDEQRALDQTGSSQAIAIAEGWTDLGVEAIYTSPALRCRQTVAPLAHRLGLELTVEPALGEGAASSQSMRFVRSFTGRTVVLCSHGDVLPDVLRLLEVGGTRLEGRGCAKASVWKLDNSTERIENAVLLRTPPLGV